MSEGPTCPVCGAAEAEPPDMLGVHRCGGCGVEFRPPLRVPIRHAGVTPATVEENKGWIVMMVGAGVVIGLTIAIGDAQAPHEGVSGIELPELTIPELPPLVPLTDLDLVLELWGPKARVELEHEVQISQPRGLDLFMTGLVRNSSDAAVSQIEFELHARDARGMVVGTYEPTLACPSMAAREVCGWSLDTELGEGVSDFEFDVRGLGRVLPGFAPFELRARFDAKGVRVSDVDSEIDFDLEHGRVVVDLPPSVTLSDAWVSITALDDQGRVLGVELERMDGVVMGELDQELRVPRPELATRFRIAVGGLGLNLGDAGSMNIGLTPVELEPVEP